MKKFTNSFFFEKFKKFAKTYDSAKKFAEKVQKCDKMARNVSVNKNCVFKGEGAGE